MPIAFADLELLFRLDTNQHWRTSLAHYDFFREMHRLEDERESAFELLDDGLDKGDKVDRATILRIPKVLG